MARTKQAIVIGAGVIGVTTAFALAKSGWQVRVLDAQNEPAAGASLGNGRQLSYSYTDALANPGLLTNLPKLALGMDDAFHIGMPRDPAWFDWMIRFLRNCTASRFARNTLDCLQLARQSQQQLDALLEEFPLDFQMSVAGKMVLYRNRQNFENAHQAMALKIAHGANQTALSAKHVSQIEPALADFEGLVGAIHSPSDRTGNCALFTRQLMALAQQEFGAQFLDRTEVKSVEQMPGSARVICENDEVLEADLAVVCAGHRSNDLLAPLGHRLQIQAMKGYSFIAPAGEQAPHKSITDSSRRIVFTNIGEQMLVAGFADLGDNKAGFAQGRMDALLRAAKSSLPDAARYDEAHDFWAGHRPVTPNSMPVTQLLGPALAVNSGHGMLGWTFAMGSAARLADAVNNPT